MVHSSGVPTVSYHALMMVGMIISFPGLLALKRAGFQVEVYYASETDGQATIICQANHSQAVTQLGDVTKITTDMVSACCCHCCMRLSVWMCVHDLACMHVCVCLCVRACVRACACGWVGEWVAVSVRFGVFV